jgi:hypothetical protein
VSGHQEVTYTLDFGAGRQSRRDNKTLPDRQMLDGDAAGVPIPRIARLMALAIRFEGLLRDGTIRDYAELARLGRVTRARMTQIMKLLDLAPDIQEQILFLPLIKGLNERNLRPIANRTDWDDQRRLFQKIMLTGGLRSAASAGTAGLAAAQIMRIAGDDDVTPIPPGGGSPAPPAASAAGAQPIFPQPLRRY